MDIAREVRGRRRHLRLTQRDVADLSGVSERFLRELEQGKESVQLDSVMRVLDALGLEINLAVRTPPTAASTPTAIDRATEASGR